MAQWLESARGRIDSLADILALRREPAWRSDHLTRGCIQAEIIGRLKGLAMREEAEGRMFPNGELLDKRIGEFGERGISPFQPGPLEGNLRPMDYKFDRQLSADDVSSLLVILNDVPSEFPWAGVSNVSTSACLPEEFRTVLTEKISTFELPNGTFVARSEPLHLAALVAVMHQDLGMANAIAERLLQEFEGEDNTQTVFFTLLIASTAFEEDEAFGWFADRLYRLAAMAPIGKPLDDLATLINELKSLLPISRWCFGRVEALCLGSKRQF